MQVINVEQGTDEWFKARESVLFTASNFNQIITAKTGKTSATIDKLTNQILLKKMLGELDKPFNGNADTERGNELEDDAIDAYEFVTGNAVRKVGFIISDDGFYGCSPDGLIGNDGMLEIKSVHDEAHIANIFNPDAYMDYIQQLQGQLLCANRQWNDWMSYHPKLAPVIIRVKRDEDYLVKMRRSLNEAREMYEEKKEKLKQLNYL